MKPRKCRKPTGAYLEHSVKLRVRFQEVDPLGIVWHGHYVTYFEDARVAFGKKYDLSYTDIRNANLLTPLTFLSCDFIRPARYDDELQVLARLYQRDSAKIEFYYEVALAKDMTLLATGATIQAFLDLNGRLLLTMPQFMRDFYRRWEDHMVNHE